MTNYEKKPWYESFFGNDYFVIYDSALTPQDSVAQVDGIVSLLKLKAGARVLDLGCGHGRHAIPLAERGFQVTGFDLSKVFLDRARRDSEKCGAKVRWTQGDMRELPFVGEFDAIINVFSSFGYFEDPRDDVKTLRGVFCFAARRPVPFGNDPPGCPDLPLPISEFRKRTADGTLVLHERQWDLARDVIDDQITLIRPDGTRTTYANSVRVRSLDEFIAVMHEAGFEAEAWYGGFDGSSLDLTSHRLVLVNRKAS